MSLPFREIALASPSMWTRARTPSHLGSNDQAGSSNGSSKDVAIIGLRSDLTAVEATPTSSPGAATRDRSGHRLVVGRRENDLVPLLGALGRVVMGTTKEEESDDR